MYPVHARAREEGAVVMLRLLLCYLLFATVMGVTIVENTIGKLCFCPGRIRSHTVRLKLVSHGAVGQGQGYFVVPFFVIVLTTLILVVNL